MKKVSVLFDKRLQTLLANDEEFKKLAVFRHALAVVNFTVELSATGIVPTPNFPILNEDFNIPEAIRFTNSELALFVEAYKVSGRIEASIWPGTAEVCLAVEIRFYAKGRRDEPLLVIHGAADSMAVRRLTVNIPEGVSNEKLRMLHVQGTCERRQRDEQEAHTRSLAHIGP